MFERGFWFEGGFYSDYPVRLRRGFVLGDLHALLAVERVTKTPLKSGVHLLLQPPGGAG